MVVWMLARQSDVVCGPTPLFSAGENARTEPFLKKCLISVCCVSGKVPAADAGDTVKALLSQHGLSKLLKIR
jgi:hypothetical protein